MSVIKFPEVSKINASWDIRKRVFNIMNQGEILRYRVKMFDYEKYHASIILKAKRRNAVNKYFTETARKEKA